MVGGALAGFLIEVPNTRLKCTAWVGGRGVCVCAWLVEAFAHLEEAIDVITFGTVPVRPRLN